MASITALSEEFVLLSRYNIPDCKKKFNKYISKLNSQFTNENDVKTFFNALNSKTDIERLFQLDIAIALQRNDFILTTLKSGNAVSIKKILKSTFLETTFTKMKTQLVNDILPQLSYSAKLKFLNRLSTRLQQSEVLEECYDSLNKKYGNTLAMYVLPGCSDEFIKVKLKECNRQFTERQLFFIAKRNPAFMKIFIKNMQEKKTRSPQIYTKILKYFASTNPEVFWSLQDEFHFDVKLGRSQTKSVLKNNVEKLRIGEKYMKFLHHDIVYKTLKKNNLLQEFLISYLPESWCSVHLCLKEDHPLVKFIQKYFRNEKIWDVLKGICEEKYSVDFTENIPDMSKDILRIMLKSKAYEKKIRNYIDQKEFINLQTTDKAIPVLKEKLSSSDEDDVAGIIKEIFENCALNNDNQALEEIMEFIFCKFKYEVRIIKEFFEMIVDWHYFTQFTPKMWEIINNFFEIYKRQNLIMNNHLPFYFNYLVENGMSTDKYLKSLVACLHMTEIQSNPFGKTKYEKIGLEAFGSTLEPLSASNLYGYMCMKYTEWVLEYNDRNTNNKILLTKYPNIIHFFSASLYEEATNIFYGCLKQFDYEQFDAELWKNFHLRVREDILVWYKRYHPEKLIENKEIVFTETDYKMEIFLMNLCNYPQTDVINAYKNHAMKVLMDINNPQGPFAILFLSVFSQDNFCDIAEKMIPSLDGKMHYGTTYEKVTLQRAITRGLKNCDDIDKKLSLIRKYCLGNYVKYCFNVFYSICATTPEILLIPYLNELHDATVIKHVRGTRKSYLFKYDAEITKVIMPPTEITKNDILPALRAMPKENHLIYLQNVSADLTSYVVTKMTEEDIENWDIEVLKYLLKKTFTPSDYFECSEFVCRCVFSNSGTRRSELLEFALETFKQYADANREKLLFDYGVHNVVSQFIHAFCKNSLESINNKEVIFELLARCPTIFDVEDFINQYLLLEFTALCFKRNFNMKDVGISINKLLSCYIEKYGGSIVTVFAQTANTLCAIQANTAEFIKGLLEDFNVNVAVMALLILPLYADYKEDTNSRNSEFDGIYNVLDGCKDPTVRFFLLRRRTNVYV